MDRNNGQSHPDSDDDLEEEYHQEHDEIPHHPHEEPWLVSYADMMTLLFGFFVLMYSFEIAKIDEDIASSVRIRGELAKFFGGQFVLPLKNELKDLSEKLVSTQGLNEIETKITPEGIEISLRSNFLFGLGDAELNPRGIEAIKDIADLIKKSEGHPQIIVEGHTDDNPLKQTEKFSSNWELGGSRAAHVVDGLIAAGFDPLKIKAISYADTRPLAANRDAKNNPIPENQARNRRVTIKITDLDVRAKPPKEKAVMDYLKYPLSTPRAPDEHQ